jgi:hypothetical protein
VTTTLLVITAVLATVPTAYATGPQVETRVVRADRVTDSQQFIDRRSSVESVAQQNDSDTSSDTPSGTDSPTRTTTPTPNVSEVTTDVKRATNKSRPVFEAAQVSFGPLVVGPLLLGGGVGLGVGLFGVTVAIFWRGSN